MRKAYGQSILIVDIVEVRTLVWGDVLTKSSIMALVYSFENVVCQLAVGWTDTCEIFLLVHFGTRSWIRPTKVHQLKSLLLFSPPSWIIIDLESNIKTITVQGMLSLFWVWFCLLGFYVVSTQHIYNIHSLPCYLTPRTLKNDVRLKTYPENQYKFPDVNGISHLFTFSIAWLLRLRTSTLPHMLELSFEHWVRPLFGQ